MLHVLIVDDLSIVRQGLKMQLGLEPDIEVVGEAASGEEALALVQQARPDVVLMDACMPGMDGFAATRATRAIHPLCAVVILSLADDALLKARAREAGAAACVGKYEGMEALLLAMRQVTRYRPP